MSILLQKTNFASTRKIFEHDFLPKIELVEHYVEGRRYYQLPDGMLVPSVTTVLSSLSKDHITEWKARVGEEQANKITTQAARRGTAIHNLAEKYLLNDPEYTKGAMPINVFNFTQIKTHLDTHVTHIRAIEHALYSHALRTAGRTDLVANWDDKLSIIDFKTSTKVKKEEWIENYFLQATCYAMMLEERHGIHVPQFVILIAVDHEAPQVFKRDTANYVERVKNLFQKYRDI